MGVVIKSNEPMVAIRDFCMECVCGNYLEVRYCSGTTCPLWLFRFGVRPRSLMKEGRREAFEILLDPENFKPGGLCDPDKTVGEIEKDLAMTHPQLGHLKPWRAKDDSPAEDTEEA